jgi:hypothetical protein
MLETVFHCAFAGNPVHVAVCVAASHVDVEEFQL